MLNDAKKILAAMEETAAKLRELGRVVVHFHSAVPVTDVYKIEIKEPKLVMVILNPQSRHPLAPKFADFPRALPSDFEVISNKSMDELSMKRNQEDSGNDNFKVMDYLAPRVL